MHSTSSGPALALFLIGSSLQAQGLGSLAKYSRLDFAVPDAPAFSLLKVEGSSVLRPSSVKELGLAVSDFVGGGAALSIPRAFAVEVAPMLIAEGPRLQVTAYQRRPWLYRLRVSAATARVEDGIRPNRVALALRSTLVDRADLRTLPPELWRIPLTQAAKQKLNAAQAVQDGLVHRVQDVEKAAAIADLVVAGYEGDSVYRLAERYGVNRAELDEIVTAAVPPSSMEEVLQLDQRLQDRRKRLADSLWNAFSIDVALGVRADGNDSTGRDLRVQKYGGWFALGAPITRSGQLLLNVQQGGERDTTTGRIRFSSTVNSRLYVGTNYLKIFVEGQGRLRVDHRPIWLLNSGGEIRPPFGGWLDFSAGLEFDNNIRESQLVTNLSYKFGLPKLFD